MSAQYTAFLDACVLYSAPLRDLLMELAVSDAYQARWSMLVLEEMKRSILDNRDDLGEAQLDRTIELMNSSVRDCVVEIPDGMIDGIVGLPDPDDRHVVAAAIQSRSHAIVTLNKRDFPDDTLSRYRIEVIDPDTFLAAQYGLDQGLFMQSVATIRARLKDPRYSVEEYLSTLIRNDLVETAGLLRPMSRFL